MTPCSEWQNFYVIVGAAAGGLTGLQFVTMALIADMPLAAEESDAGAAFSTPTIVHFGAVLTLAAVLVVPWRGMVAAAVIWGAMGLVGALYCLLVAWQFRAQRAYKPVFEDWFFRVILPLAAYSAWAVSACLARFGIRNALFAVAAAAVVLLLTGIHNAWDNVTYLVFVKRRREQ